MKKEQILVLIPTALFLIIGNYSIQISLIIIVAILLASHILAGIGRSIPLLGLLSLAAFVQLVLAPSLIDEFGLDFLENSSALPLPDNIYYWYVIPAVLALVLGISIVPQPYSVLAVINKAENHIKQNQGINYWLLALGVIGIVTKDLFPSALLFLGHLLSQLIYIGAFYSLYSTSKNRTLIVTLVLVFTFVLSVASGLFWNIIMWGLFFLMVYALKHPPKFITKIFAFTFGLVLLVLLQLVKDIYRGAIEETDLNTTEKLALFQEIGTSEWSSLATPNVDSSPSTALIGRLNQGYWDGLVYARVPMEVDYAQGETIFMGTLSGLIPRFLWPDKPTSDVGLFTKYTGYTDNGDSYFSLSPIAEAYLNFGVSGGILFLFLFGCFLKYIFSKLIKISYNSHPTLILWLPLIFFQVIRVETDFNVIFNHLIKSLVFAFISFKSFNLILKIKI